MKYDGCNTNVVPVAFGRGHCELFRVVQNYFTVTNSNKKSVEEASELIREGALLIGTQTYALNRVVESSRYDVLLGFLWLVANAPTTDYRRRFIRVNIDVIPLVSRETRNTGSI